MKKIERYLAHHIILSIFIVLFVLTALNLVFSFLGEFQRLKNNYQFLQALTYVGLNVPTTALQMLPISALIGCILGLGALAMNGELFVLPVYGTSLYRICWTTITSTFLFIALGLFVAEVLHPSLVQKAKAYRDTARAGEDRQETGIWWRQGNHYIYVEKIQNKKILRNINIISTNTNGKINQTLFASYATKTKSTLKLHDVKYVTYTPEEMKTHHQKTMHWPNDNLNTKLMKITTSMPQDMSLRNLYAYINYLKEQKLDTHRYHLAFYSKLFYPLTIIAFALLGASFVFGPLRSGTMGNRLFYGILTGLALLILQRVIEPASIVFGFSSIIATLLPSLLCFLVALILLRRAA